ncbi:MAG: ribosome-associated translation inhibitor RaiA [Candidatus Pacebacteria bacterium]|nr:ribosome-associated translation inhibitor RaiA [Candidatus Paceibacterota bacterium]
MRISIKAINIKLDEALKVWVEKKIGGIEKFLVDFGSREYFKEKPNLEVKVEIGKTTRHHLKGEVFRAQAQLYLPKQVIRAEAVSEDLRDAINQVKDELQREVKRYKGKRIDRARKWARKMKELTRLHRVLIRKDKLSKIFKKSFRRK